MSSPFNEEKYKRLLEGLEVSEVKYSEIRNNNEEFRLDDDYYRKEYVSIYNQMKNYVLLL